MQFSSAAYSPAAESLALGAQVGAGGVIYRVWAPDHAEMAVRIVRPNGANVTIPLEPQGNGLFAAEDRVGRAGERYKFSLPDGSLLPDPASRFQPEGVHSWSECVDPRTYRWRSAAWRRPGWSGQSIYELHVGTFTAEGTFRAAIKKLPHVAALGVDAIQLMPVADFPGARNWGYDGVALFAPARCYGRPDDLRELVDAAHECGLAVILDVVYNHLGPDGNYLGRYAAAYFHPDRATPWGKTFNLSGSDSRPVRDFFLTNAAYWFDEFRFDGLRLDATHAIIDDSPRHLLAEIADTVHKRGGFLIAEDERNSCELLRRADGSGLQIDAVWADDFHHQVRVGLTGIREDYFKGFRGLPEDLARTLDQGWFFTGQPYPFWGNRPRGEACAHLPPSAFIYCIENHDQTGNRARGERLEHLVSAAAFRAVSALLCLSPYPPLIFMGQEWAASTPFLFFTDHHDDLGAQVTAGRAKEFPHAGMHSGAKNSDTPDPQASAAFLASKLSWDEVQRATHASVLALYCECLRQRATWLTGETAKRGNWDVYVVNRVVIIRYHGPHQPERLVVSALRGGSQLVLAETAWLRPPVGHAWRLAFESSPLTRELDPPASAPDDWPPVETLVFDAPATVLLVLEKNGEPHA